MFSMVNFNHAVNNELRGKHQSCWTHMKELSVVGVGVVLLHLDVGEGRLVLHWQID